MSKRALLVGINRYGIPGNDLRGCINDVTDVQAALIEHCGFTPSGITTLTDLAATTKAMRAAIQRLITSGKKGDVLLFHYSGHGSNVPDQDGDEADERDEILCPTDLDWKDPLLDDWLRRTFDRLKAGVNLTVIMDCCHSGTNTRAIMSPDAPSIPRYLPNPWDIMATESRRRLRGNVTGELRRSSRARRRKSDVVSADIGEVLITGCRDTQTSADVQYGRRFNGALTHALVASIRAARGKLTNHELHARTLTELKRNGEAQTPQLEGRASAFDRAFLEPLT